ncbi:hypothetical protein [Pseudoxanthomonas sp.]|uniref:hypothetical protein n=1 Tax=Pseudoxanthomonas sp. TaxID=1871049 RepID=UPI0025F69AAE|nr:hypothetical protein [Pseudoxanthomonas sp.]
MGTCFVIQPFDRAKFDKRYKDCFEPAIRAADLEPYRVDGDPSADVLIASIEDGIRNASACLAEITSDNPNVWYELGYAMALGKPVIMICSEERHTPFPFDIRHRSIITYKTESASDFQELGKKIVSTIQARLSKAEIMKQAAESDLVSGVHGLSHVEVVVVAAIATEADQPLATVGLRNVKQLVEKQGVTALGAQLAIRRLATKSFAQVSQEEGEWGFHDVIQLTDAAWNWIENNDSLFVLNKPPAQVSRTITTRNAKLPVLDDFVDEDIPF